MVTRPPPGFRQLALPIVLASALLSLLLKPLFDVEEATQAPLYRRLLPAVPSPPATAPPASPPLPNWALELRGSIEQIHPVPAPRPPRLTRLANFSYRPTPAATAEQLRGFQEDGFVVLRNVIDAEVLDELRAWAAEYCAERLLSAASCQVEQARWVSDVLRDFVLFGPVGRLASPFMRGRGVRVKEEGFFGHRYQPSWRAQPFFSYGLHVDTSAQVGLSGGLRSDTVALHAWVPLQDIDPASGGGGIQIVPGLPRTLCPFHFGYRPTHDQNVSRTAAKRECDAVAQRKTILSFRKGDIAFWHPNMLHATQPVLDRRNTRYAWYARLSESDGIMCNYQCTVGLPYVWGGDGVMPCCGHGLRSGDQLRGPCFPQVHPSLLEDEVSAHLVQVPAPLVHGYRGDSRGARRDHTYWSLEDMDASCRGTMHWTE